MFPRNKKGINGHPAPHQSTERGRAQKEWKMARTEAGWVSTQKESKDARGREPEQERPGRTKSLVEKRQGGPMLQEEETTHHPDRQRGH